MEDTVTCKQCRHIRRDWSFFPFSIGSPYAWKCSRVVTKEESEFDPISGKTKVIPARPQTCVSARSKYGECGIEGVLWEPRRQKDFFIYLKRV